MQLSLGFVARGADTAAQSGAEQAEEEEDEGEGSRKRVGNGF